MKLLYLQKILFYSFISTILSLWCSFPSFGQLERKVVEENTVEEMTFHAPRHINLLTVEPVATGELHWAIMHTFSTLDNGVRNLFGIDNGANVRLSFEYGFSERFSVGFARSSIDKVFDFHARYHFLQQTQNNSMPISLSFMGGYTVNSADYSFLAGPEITLGDRSAYMGQIMIARKFSETFSLQVSPMFAYFNNMQNVFRVEGDEDLYLALGFSSRIRLAPRFSLTAQYIPNLNTDLNSNFGLGMDIEAGGHVFQLYFVTSPMLNETYLLAGGNGNQWDQFRIGFNVNRIFTIKR
ncbi:MAG: DUF5777 family beta-barrel protein [Cyclobacteriaceae bacterium]|nr:hypothetical protein [Cyclobacteriaceae bacterium]MCH8515339.1 DUF5777 family beta-barrel protein [Cyclobacteriaceae bacterium]